MPATDLSLRSLMKTSATRAALRLGPSVEAGDFGLRQPQTDHGIAARCGAATFSLFRFSRYCPRHAFWFSLKMRPEPDEISCCECTCHLARFARLHARNHPGAHEASD